MSQIYEQHVGRVSDHPGGASSVLALNANDRQPTDLHCHKLIVDGDLFGEKVGADRCLVPAQSTGNRTTYTRAAAGMEGNARLVGLPVHAYWLANFLFTN